MTKETFNGGNGGSEFEDLFQRDVYYDKAESAKELLEEAEIKANSLRTQFLYAIAEKPLALDELGVLLLSGVDEKTRRKKLRNARTRAVNQASKADLEIRSIKRKADKKTVYYLAHIKNQE